MGSETATKDAATGTPDKHTGSRRASRDSGIHEGPDRVHATVAGNKPATSNGRATARGLPVSVADVPARAVVTGQGRAADPSADAELHRLGPVVCSPEPAARYDRLHR